MSILHIKVNYLKGWIVWDDYSVVGVVIGSICKRRGVSVWKAARVTINIGKLKSRKNWKKHICIWTPSSLESSYSRCNLAMYCNVSYDYCLEIVFIFQFERSKYFHPCCYVSQLFIWPPLESVGLVVFSLHWCGEIYFRLRCTMSWDGLAMFCVLLSILWK